MYENQERLYLVIVSRILVTVMCDSGVILQGEIRCWSFLGVKGLTYRAVIKMCNLTIHGFQDLQFSF